MRVSAFGLVLCLLATVSLSGAKARAADVRRTFELPRVEGIEIDGKADDWTGRGYGFEILLPQHGKHREAEDHNASMTLGWTREGLLFLVRVQDDVWHRKTRQKDPIGQDHVEIYLRKERRGEGSAAYHLTFNPSFGDFPLKTSCYGGLELGPGNVDRSVSTTYGITGGKTWYVLEGLVPWQSVDFKAAPGAKPFFQLWVQDGDTMENEGLRKYRASFHLGHGTSYNGGDMHELKLVDDTKPGLRLTAVDGYDLSTYQSYVKVMARGIRRGHEVTISNGTDVLAKGVFEADGPDRASAKIMLPLRISRNCSKPVATTVFRIWICSFDLHVPEIQALQEVPVHFEPDSDDQLPVDSVRNGEWEYGLAIQDHPGVSDLLDERVDRQGVGILAFFTGLELSEPQADSFLHKALPP